MKDRFKLKLTAGYVFGLLSFTLNVSAGTLE